MTTPVLIVVCGAPATGKTTLARRLAADLRLPLLEKDTVKESLAETVEIPDRAASRRVGAASFRVLYDLAFAILSNGSNVMIETNLNRDFVTPELARLVTVATVQIIQCDADRQIIEQRYRERATGDECHAAHFDRDAVPDLVAGVKNGVYDLTPLN